MNARMHLIITCCMYLYSALESALILTATVGRFISSRWLRWALLGLVALSSLKLR